MNIHVFMFVELSTSFIVIDTKLFTNHRNLKIVRETRLQPNLLTDWHDALVGISPRTTQPIPINRHRRHRSERSFFLVLSLFRVYPTDNCGITLGKLFQG